MSDYERLVAARKACRICMTSHPGEIRSGAELTYDPDVVSYWSQWLGHQQPELLIVGQDFADFTYFQRNRGCDDHDSRTNGRLRELLSAAGIAVAPPPHRDHAPRVYLTNSILCLKEGHMASPIRGQWVKACTERHLKPLIAHLRPAIVVGMGGHGWRAVRQLFQLRHLPVNLKPVAGSAWTASDQTRVFAVGHCSPLGLANRCWEDQLADWRRIGDAIATLPLEQYRLRLTPTER